MKTSTYNELFNMADDSYIIYNHLHKKLVKICSPERDLLNLPTSLLDYLKANDFLVDDNIDENYVAMVKYNDYIFDNTLRLVLLPNEECNFSCTFCYEKFNKVCMDDGILKKLILYLRKNITKYSSLDIDWFGGEPLLSKNFIYKFSEQAIDLCKLAKIPYVASITTNGYLLDDETISRLLKCGVRNFHVTLCGDESEHDEIRYLSNGGKTFSRIIQNLQKFKSLTTHSFKVVIRINVTNRTLKNLHVFIDKLYDLFGDDSRFTFYYRPVGDWGGEKVKAMSEDINIDHKRLFNSVFSAKKMLNYDIYYTMLVSNICASAKRNNYVIRANGDINKCTESLYSSYNKIGFLDNNGNMNIDTELLGKWLFSHKKADECGLCTKYTVCKNNKCPNTNFDFSSKREPYCGYDDIAIEEVIKILDGSNSKYISVLL